METFKILKAVETTVEELFIKNERPYLLYHNSKHTHTVVRRAKGIADFYSLDKERSFILLVAAWYHDTGHLLGNMQQHEELGARLMRMFLGDKIEDQMLNDIHKCIMATKMDTQPVSLVEQILCDADTYHLGTPEFRETDPLVWKELELRTGKTIDKQSERSLHFLESHSFFTPYCQGLLNAGKMDNIQWLKAKID
jgi:hypothetical protein